MSKLRKTLSILVAIALVVTMLTPAVFAEEDGEQVKRVAGENRYATSADIALDKFDSAETVIIVNGEDRFAYADGLAASVLAGALDAPILLTDANELSDAVADAIEELGASKAYILGGTTAVSEAVEEALEDLDLDITRLDGENRYETAALIAEEADTDSKTAYVVNGWANADAMVAGAAAFDNGNPILLVAANEIPEVTAEALNELGIEEVVIVGGTAVVSKAVADELDKDYDVKRIAGEGRYETSAVFAEESFDNPAGVSIVNGWRLADAIGASVYGNPIVYANANGQELDKPVNDYIDDLIEDNPNLNITLFGGPVALANSLQKALENKLEEGEIVVRSVQAITETVNDSKSNQRLELAINGQNKPTSVQDLEKAGYTVEFSATSPVFVGERFTSNTGVLLASQLTAGQFFSYKVTVYKNSEVVAESGLQEVEVVADNTSGIATIHVKTDKISTVTSGKIATQDKNVKLTVIGIKDNDPENFVDITTDVKLTSSDNAIASVDKNGNVSLNGGTGSVTFTAETANGEKSSITLDVVKGERRIDANKTEVQKTDIKFANTGATTNHQIAQFTVIARDQFGDVIDGQDIYVAGKSGNDAYNVTNSSGTVIAEITDDGNGNTTTDFTTDSNGIAVIYVEYVGDKNGNGEIEVRSSSATGTLLGKVKVSAATYSGSESYKLDVANSANTKTIDANKNNSLVVKEGKHITTLMLTKVDRNGNLVDIPLGNNDLTAGDSNNDEYRIEIDGKNNSDYVDVTWNADGTITVEAKKQKNSAVKIEVFKGGASVATTNITVTDSRTKITGFSFDSIPARNTTDSIKLNEVLTGIQPANDKAIAFEIQTSNNEIYILEHDGSDNPANAVHIGTLKLTTTGDISATFNTNSSGEIIIEVSGSKGDSGSIVLAGYRVVGDLDKNGNPEPQLEHVKSTEIKVNRLP